MTLLANLDNSQRTQNTLLRGRITIKQMLHGNRSSLEPVLMAAAVPARPNQTILSIGCGNGAELLCLFSRVPNTTGVGIEKDPPTARLCQENLSDNHAQDRFQIITGSFPDDLPSHLKFDHCMSNPPWHSQQSTLPANSQRSLARSAPPSLLSVWIKGAKQHLKHKGTLTLILPASQIDQAITQMRLHGFGDVTLFPFWPKRGRDARVALLQGRYGMKGGSIITPGAILHENNGEFTPLIRGVLDKGNPLNLRGGSK